MRTTWRLQVKASKAPKEDPYDFEFELEAMRNNGSVVSLEARLVAFDNFSCLDGETSSDTKIHNWDDEEINRNGT